MSCLSWGDNPATRRVGEERTLLLISQVCSVPVSGEVEGGGRHRVSIGSNTADSHSSYQVLFDFHE